MPTVRLDLSYDGTDFRGYAKQPDVRTVQSELERALDHRFGPVETTVAGRTDAGVHARHQVVSFVVDTPVDLDAAQRSLNRLLPDDIVVTAIATAPDGFSARFSATRRQYRYVILNQRLPDPFLRRVSWHVADDLDAFAMNQAARLMVGEHDFASFCRKAQGRSTVRTVTSAKWTEPQAAELRFEIDGSSFCHQMVRSIVALCVDVGRGLVDVDDVGAIRDARDRNEARGAAPPHGLTLWHIEY